MGAASSDDGGSPSVGAVSAVSAAIVSVISASFDTSPSMLAVDSIAFDSTARN